MATRVRLPVLIVFSVLLIWGIAEWADTAAAEAEDFFSQALAASGTNERVVIDGGAYEVTEGRVTHRSGKPADRATSREALRIAYFAATAKHAPLFGMAGSDPDKIGAFAEELGSVAASLGALQETASQTEDVAAALYPVSFLKSLAETERLRRQFIAEPSDVLSYRYALALQNTLRHYERDLRIFIGAFNRQVDDGIRYRVLGGLITKESFLAAARDALQQITLVRNQHAAERACLAGATRACSPENLLPPDLPSRAPETRPDAEPRLLEEILSIYKNADPSPTPFTASVIALETSACVPDFPTPQQYLFKSGRGALGLQLGGSLRFLNELYSYTTPHLAEFLEGRRVSPSSVRPDAPGVLFALYQPTAFYQCPELGADIAAAQATEAAYAALEIPHTETIGGYPLREEGVAYRAVREALKTYSAASAEHAQVLDVARMFADHSGRLEDVIEEAVFNQRSNIAQYRAGFSPDIQASWQFAVKSGFSSLFLLHHKSMGESSISIFAEHSTQPDALELLPWSYLRNVFSPKQVSEDLRTFLLMHLPPQTSAAAQEE